ncbi:hypothetical protein DOY81_005345, partial [Sarcophaga bullata]
MVENLLNLEYLSFSEDLKTSEPVKLSMFVLSCTMKSTSDKCCCESGCHIKKSVTDKLNKNPVMQI